jgi:hypothetical protein
MIAFWFGIPGVQESNQSIEKMVTWDIPVLQLTCIKPPVDH